MPSRTSCVRFSPRPSRSSTSTTRSECSLWRKLRSKRSRSAASSAGLAGVAERRVPEIVAEADRLGQILVEAQRARDRARDAHRLERVRQPRAVVVALGRDEDLRLVLQAPERLAVRDAVAVALERAAEAARLLLDEPSARLRRAHGERREAALPPRARGARGSGRRLVQCYAFARVILRESPVAPRPDVWRCFRTLRSPRRARRDGLARR